MIKVNGYISTYQQFPDGTMRMDFDCKKYAKGEVMITWLYESDMEMIQLYYLRYHLKENGVTKICLEMPYIPNARNDRTESPENVFTLKYFARFINGLKFDEVYVSDPHSTVSEALFLNLRMAMPVSQVEEIYNNLEKYHQNPVMIFYPDKGSEKRYSNIIPLPYTYGTKKRDWKTGEITSFEIANGEEVQGKTILIVDDICSKGGTFYHSAKKLKELGADNIYLYITHCENSILKGDLIKSGLLEKIYTTNSIFTKQHDLIEVMNIW